MRLTLTVVALALLLPAASLRSSEYPFFAMDTGTKDAKHKTPESQVKMLKELGYAGVGHTGFGNIPEMLKLLDANGLKMFTVYVGVSLDKGTVDGLQQGVKALEGRDTLIWLTVKSRKFAASSIEGDERAVEVVGKIADVAAKAKLRVALYPHARTFVERVEDAVRIAKKCGRENVGATFNLCHWLNEGRESSLVPVLKQAIPYLYVVSINGAESGGKGWKQLIQPLDRGSFDNARLLATLKHLDYKGPVGLQGYGIGGDVHTNLTRSMKAWRAIQEKVAEGEAQPLTGNETFAQLGTYRQGASRAACSAIHNRFVAATPDARGPLESMLTDLLENPDATIDSKREACRMLKKWGTAKSVPALAKLLHNDKLAHMALDALHAKPCPEVDEALRRALKQIQDDLKPGVIATIGARSDRKAVSTLTKLTADANQTISRAAIKALGDIGGTQAAKALEASKTPELKELKALAQLKCAESMLAEGEKAAAADVFNELFKADYAPVRIAALAGICRADEKRATPLVLAKLKDQDHHLRRTAIGLLTEMTDPEMTKALAAELTSADTDTKIALLAALARRGDKTATPAVARIASSRDETVRIAALQALCALGDATHVKQLAETAGEGGLTGEAAANALNRLKADGVDKAILECVKDANPEMRIVLVKSMAVRHTPNAVRHLMQLAKDTDAAVRREALRALGLLSGPDDLPHLVKHLTISADPQDRTAAANMILKVAKAMDDKERRRKDLVAALPGSEPVVRVQLISILGGLGEFEIVKGALNDKSTEVQDAAVRTLADWPDATPMTTLHELAKKASREVHHVLALRGYVRMLGLPSAARTPAEELNLYRAALEHARRPEEKKLILNALGNIADPGVLALIEKYMAEKDTKAEAVTAYLKAAKLVGTMSPGAVRKKLESMANAKGPAAKKVQDVLDWIKQSDGYITTWLVAGPYTHEGGSLFDQSFPPEQPGAQDVAWRLTSGVNGPFTKHITPGAINLGAIIGGNNRTAYLRTGVYCPEKRKALLQLGSDDAVKVWLNGKPVHAKNARRAVKRAEDVVQVELKEGWNILLMKIVQGNGEWGACARFANLDGSLMEGLLVRPQQQAMK